MTDRWLSAWGLAAVAFGGASLIVPLYVVELGGTPFDLGVLFAASSFVGVPAALVFGNLADRTGKRRAFVLGAMVLTVATTAAIPLLGSIGPVIVAASLLWFGFAAATPVLTLLVVAGEPETAWSDLIASLNRFQGIGWAAGLALGFVVTAAVTAVADPIAAQRAFFVVCTGASAVGLVLAWRTLPADSGPDAGPSPRQLRKRLRGAARFNVRGAAFPVTPSRFDLRGLHPRRFVERFTPGLAAYFTAALLAFTGFGVFFAPLPAYLSGLGFGSDGIFALYLALNTAAALCFGRVGGVVDRFGLLRVHAGGLLVRAAALPLVAVVGVVVGGSLLGTGVVGVAFVVIGLTWAVISVTAATLVTRLAPAVIRGEALGVYGALVAVGGGIGGLLGGWLAAYGYLVAFGVAGGLVAAGTAVLVFLSRSRATTAVPRPESA